MSNQLSLPLREKTELTEMMHTRWKYSTFFALLVNICIAVLINKITKIRRATFVKSKNCCLIHKPFTVNVSQNEVLSVSFVPSVKQQNKSYGKTNERKNSISIRT